MRFWARWMAVFLGLLGVSLAAPATAQAATGVDQVVAALGLASEPADYVILVDTSGSMKAGGRYATVRSDLGKLVAGLDSDDRVSMLTFDTTVVPRFRGVVGRNPNAVVATLPALASGKHTDIGAAIAAGLSELEKPDTHRLAALILITDGNLDAPGSKYEQVSSAAWKQLKTRAAELGKAHQVAAYAVSLQTTTDAGLLKKVLPQATEVAASQVGVRFAQVGNDLVRLQAAEALKNELSQPIVVNWKGDLGAALANGTTADVQLEFASPYPHVPVELSDIRAQASPGLQVQLSGLPATIKLKPNGRVTVPARVTVTGSGGSDAVVKLTATASSSWQKALTDGLGLGFAPSLKGSAPVPAAPIKLPPTLLPTIAGVAAPLIGLVLFGLLVRALLVPSMSGLLTVQRNGRELADIVLEGRRMKLSVPEAVTELSGLSGSVAGARAGRSQHAVRLDARFGGATARGVIADGAALALGDLEISYTSGRRRILDKIGLPRPEVIGNSVDVTPVGDTAA